jgi:helicase
VLAVWNGPVYEITPIKRGNAAAELPSPNAGEPGAAIFTWRGDYRADGWLMVYSRTT